MTLAITMPFAPAFARAAVIGVGFQGLSLLVRFVGYPFRLPGEQH